MTAKSDSTLFEAAAGSGKTTMLVDLALGDPRQRILLTTYTDENVNEIGAAIARATGYTPSNIDLLPWFTFLLKHAVKPFFWHAGFGEVRINGVLLVNAQSAQRTFKTSANHYLTPDNLVYTDRLAELALYIDEKTHGAVFERLRDIYDKVFIDEAQDLSGYELDFIKEMIRSGIQLVMAADQRQATYHTNYSSKNGPYRELGLHRYLEDKGLASMCRTDRQTLSGCHRCNQGILDLANSLFPEYAAARSVRDVCQEDELLPCVHIVSNKSACSYIEQWNPSVLRNDVRTSVADNCHPQNFGASKGRTYDRVLIYPTGPIKDWLGDSTRDLKPQARSKFYVALTRARYSVGIVGSRALANKSGLPLLGV